VFRALAKNPANRYQTAAQLRNDLAAFAGRPYPPGTSPPGELASSPPRRRLHIPGPGPVIATAAAILGLTLTFAFWYWSHRGDAEESGTPAFSSGPALAPAPVAPPAPPPVQPAAPPAPSQAQNHGPADGDADAGTEADGTHAAHAAGRGHKPAAKPVAPPPPPPEPGTLSLAVAPWGQVFVDGTDMGVAPPLNRLNLGPGTHQVELRNGAAPAFSTQITIESGKTLVLQHRF